MEDVRALDSGGGRKDERNGWMWVTKEAFQYRILRRLAVGDEGKRGTQNVASV